MFVFVFEFKWIHIYIYIDIYVGNVKVYVFKAKLCLELMYTLAVSVALISIGQRGTCVFEYYVIFCMSH